MKCIVSMCEQPAAYVVNVRRAGLVSTYSTVFRCAMHSTNYYLKRGGHPFGGPWRFTRGARVLGCNYPLPRRNYGWTEQDTPNWFLLCA